MKRYNVIYYFLFVAVVMGAFASMAQNSYGMKLMGGACLGFFLTFLHELVFALRTYEMDRRSRIWFATELTGLSIISLLFFFRSFLIEISIGKEAVLLSLAILLIVCVYYALASMKPRGKDAALLTYGVLFYYGSLAMFIVTFFAGVLNPEVAQKLGPAGFVLLAVSFLCGIGFGKRVVLGEETTLHGFIGRLRNKSGILMIGFLLMFIYLGMNQTNVLPPLYSGEMPPGYLELIRHSESGMENTDGKKKYEQFAAAYSRFVKRHRK